VWSENGWTEATTSFRLTFHGNQNSMRACSSSMPPPASADSRGGRLSR
jgi:hypothetical protein